MTRDEIVHKARWLLQERRDQENLELLETAVGHFPEDPEIRLLYGTALVPFRPNEAPQQLAFSIKLDPESPENLTRAASILLHLGEVDAARSYIGRAAQLAPESFIFRAELTNLGGKLASIRGEVDLAKEAFEAAVEAEPRDLAFSYDLAACYFERGEVGAALAVVNCALDYPATTRADQERRERLVILRERLAIADEEQT